MWIQPKISRIVQVLPQLCQTASRDIHASLAISGEYK